MTTVLAIIFVLAILVFVHELGHYLAARSVGIRVERFYIGFNLFGLGIKRKIGDTEYGLGLFPLGGYVKMAGMIDESMDATLLGEPWEFQSKNALQKIWVMSAGVLGNMLLAIIIFSGLTWTNGINETDPSAIIGTVVPDYPASQAGFLAGDRIMSVNGVTVSTWDQITEAIHALPELEIIITGSNMSGDFSRALITTKGELLIDSEIKVVGLIGISPVVNNRPAGFVEGFTQGLSLTGRWFVMTYKSLGMIVSGAASIKQVGGPIMIAQMAGESARAGFATLLGLMAIISINFAFINILPIPALDGGQIFITLIEVVRRKPLPIRARMAIQQVGVLLLLTLMAVVIFNDIARIMN
ncbi:RIP metalloprotease RseP [Candidatus Neomarinimicrobiota bacterium]